MRQYEVTFIVDPVLSGDEIKSTAKTYENMLTKEGSKIVHVEEAGLRQLAYPLNRRNSGIFYTIEFSAPIGDLIPKLELALRRDERIVRFLTVKLDKYGIKYNEDKRNGLIGVAKRPEPKKDNRRERGGRSRSKAPAPKTGSPKATTPKTETPKAPAPKAEAPAPKAEAIAPKVETPAPKAETPKAPAPKSETPKVEAPANDDSKVKNEEE